jgi:hypothetical protein
MNDWIDELARELGIDPLAPEEMGALLKLARDVAHGVERKFAPLSTYLLGVAVGARAGSGADRAGELGSALSAARAFLPPAAGP